MPSILTKDNVDIHLEIIKSNGKRVIGKSHTIIADQDFWDMLQGTNLEKDNEGNTSVEFADEITIRYKGKIFTLQKQEKCV